MSYYMKCKHGSISFHADGTPSQCGMTIIHSVYFKEVKDKEKLYAYFLNEVIFGKKDLESHVTGGWGYGSIQRDSGRWNVNKYIMTDYKRGVGHKGAHLYEFCKVMGAMEGDLVPNPNSGNKIRSFEFNRKSIDEVTLLKREEETVERNKVRRATLAAARKKARQSAT